jgi:ATPase subunit of ABC transporter with duplicated ATPase domains
MTIALKNIEKVYGAKSVLKGISIAFNQGERVALIGENGVGKTTLLRICAGLEEPTGGDIFRDEHTVACFVPQDFPEEFTDSDMTAENYARQFGSDSLMRSVKRVWAEFEQPESALGQTLVSLSGGQKKMLDLSIAFARKPQYLFLDEPENHIDVFARQELIRLIGGSRSCVVFVSHDQNLINSVTNRIAEIEDGRLTSYTGTYQFYLEQKAKREAGIERSWKSHEKKVDQLDRLIKRMHEWVQKNPDLGAQLRSRKTQLERLQKNAPAQPKVRKRFKLALSDNDPGYGHGKRMLLIKGLSLSAGDKSLLRGVDLALFSGEKIALVGRNGSGKSTLLKAIMGRIPPSQGEVRLGQNVTPGYFSQESQESLDQARTPLDLVSEVYPAHEHKIRALLANYLIGVDACSRPVSTLSGGQKTRLRFCLLFMRSPEFLLLDEPTNHLDPVSWDILLQGLKEYKGTVLVVSHDRMFIDEVFDKLWIIEDREILEYRGKLAEYLNESVP